jgi:hypothetical protein
VDMADIQTRRVTKTWKCGQNNRTWVLAQWEMESRTDVESTSIFRRFWWQIRVDSTSTSIHFSLGPFSWSHAFTLRREPCLELTWYDNGLNNMRSCGHGRVLLWWVVIGYYCTFWGIITLYERKNKIYLLLLAPHKETAGSRDHAKRSFLIWTGEETAALVWTRRVGYLTNSSTTTPTEGWSPFTIRQIHSLFFRCTHIICNV